MRLTAAFLIVLCTACSSDRGAAPATTASGSDVSALVALWIPLRLGATLDEARAAIPGLASTGWQSGSRATWVGTLRDIPIELESNNDRVVRISFELVGAAADAGEKTLGDRLGTATDCSPMPAEIRDFRPRLWAVGTGSVTTVRKKTRFIVDFNDPANPDFAELLARCRQ